MKRSARKIGFLEGVRHNESASSVKNGTVLMWASWRMQPLIDEQEKTIHLHDIKESPGYPRCWSPILIPERSTGIPNWRCCSQSLRNRSNHHTCHLVTQQISFFYIFLFYEYSTPRKLVASGFSGSEAAMQEIPVVFSFFQTRWFNHLFTLKHGPPTSIHSANHLRKSAESSSSPSWLSPSDPATECHWALNCRLQPILGAS
jgi:hypothetical protein